MQFPLISPSQPNTGLTCAVYRLVMRCLVLLGVLAGLAGPAAAQPTPVRLDDSTAVAQVWPAVRILADPLGQRSIEQAMEAQGQFAAPAGAHGSLGIRKDVIWLQFPLVANTSRDSAWVLDIDYPPLNHIEFYLVHNGQVLRHDRRGNLEPHALRTIQGRTPAFGMTLQAGERYNVYLRIQHTGAFVLPLTVNSPAAFLKRSLQEQMLQGLLTGLALCLLAYSLAQWLTLGTYLYAKYAMLVLGGLLFTLHHFGIGPQYLWPGNAWMESHVGGLSSMIAVTGSFLFNEQVLAQGGRKPWFSRFMLTGAGVTTATALCYGLDIIDVFWVTAVTSTFGLTPALISVPGAVARVRRGDSIGLYFIVAWITYFVTTAITVALLKGHVGANFWTQHAFQFGAAIDLLLFMRVMGLQTKALHAAAQRAALEHDTLRSLAHTDPLTGLLNRRGLHAATDEAIRHAAPDRIAVLYLLDLDGFKQVNDQHGHDVGDELLIAVTQRLQAHVRSTDVIARLGGDEFVVISSGLPAPQQARELGEKLIKTFDAPFVLSAHTCQVGLTVGYALAPLDGRETRSLLKRADAAMYEGKQAGKHCLRRTESPATSGGPALRTSATPETQP